MSQVKAVIFKNFSNEPFVCSWDSIPYHFAAGQEMYVEDWKAEHFTKHLVNRELDKKGIITSNKTARTQLEKLAMPIYEDIPSISAEEIIDANEQKKRGRPRKVVVEEEFADLN